MLQFGDFSRKTSAYSTVDRTRHLYSISGVYLSRLNLRLLSKFNILEAFWCILQICGLHERFLVKVTLKSSCEVTSSTTLFDN